MIKEDSANIEIVRSALKPDQQRRLLQSASSKAYPLSIFKIDAPDIIRSVANIINKTLPDARRSLVYFDIATLGKSAKRILNPRHQVAALVAFTDVKLSGNITLQPGDIAVYNLVDTDVAALVPRRDASSDTAPVMRYYHTLDQPFKVVPEIMATIAQNIDTQAIMNLCSSAKTFDDQLCRSEVTLQQLWKTNISERVPLINKRIENIQDRNAKIDAMLDRYVKALELSELDAPPPALAGRISDMSRHGYEKLLMSVLKRVGQLAIDPALVGAAKSGRFELFKSILALGKPEDAKNYLKTHIITGGSVDLLKYFETLPASVGVVYGRGDLNTAAESGNLDMFLYVKSKATLDPGSDESALFMSAVRGGNVNILKLIDYTPPDILHILIIRDAARYGDLATLQYLYNLGLKNPQYYEEAVIHAILSRDLSNVDFVISRVNNLREIILKSSTNGRRDRNNLTYNPVLKSIELNVTIITEHLLARSGLSLKAAIKRQESAFISAAFSGNVETFKYLLNSGLSYSHLREGVTATFLDTAATKGHLRMVKYLISIIKYTTNEINHAMLLAADNNHYRIVKYFISEGGSRNVAIAHARNRGMNRLESYLGIA